MTSSAVQTWDAIYHSGRPMRWWPSEDVVRFCARRLTPGMCVVEVGCGTGANLWGLLELGYHVAGIDISGAAIETARQLCAARSFKSLMRLRLWVGVLGQLSQSWGGEAGLLSHGVDAIIDCRASQHVAWSQHGTVYREYSELLKPGGWLFLLHLDDQTQPDARGRGLMAGESYTWNNVPIGVYADNGLVCMPPRAALAQVVARAGFIVRRCEELLRIGETTVCAHIAIDAQTPRE